MTYRLDAPTNVLDAPTNVLDVPTDLVRTKSRVNCHPLAQWHRKQVWVGEANPFTGNFAEGKGTFKTDSICHTSSFDVLGLHFTETSN